MSSYLFSVKHLSLVSQQRNAQETSIKPATLRSPTRRLNQLSFASAMLVCYHAFF